MSDERTMPTYWYAPEVLVKKKSFLESDVWSYGVVLYEIASLGEQPYAFPDNSSQSLTYDHQRVHARIKENLEQKYYEFNCISHPDWKDIVIQHMAHHNISHDEVERFFFKLMRDCFNYDHQRRPRYDVFLEF